MKNILIIFLLSVSSFLCIAQKNDTLATVKVIAIKEINVAATTTPLQVLNTQKIATLNSLNVADAIKYFAGVNVKDYGGIGGLKTVSIRSLGANHTGILYDGIAIGDAQGGQIDLGKFSLDNVAQIELYNSSPTDILSPAKSYATASVLNLKTNNSILLKNEKQVTSLKIQQGSFGLISPSVAFKTLIDTKFQLSATGWYQYAKGNYKYQSYENDNRKIARENADINANRFEIDGVFAANDSDKLSLKLYRYQSKRGLPGAVILFNNNNTQRLNDNNFFIQSSYKKSISPKNSLLFDAKYANDKIDYLDPSFPNSAGMLENNFRQKEYYISAAWQHIFSTKISASFASDFTKNKLTRTDTFAQDFANPSRYTYLNNIAIQFKENNFSIATNLLHTSLTEKVTNGKAGRNFTVLTPALSAIYGFKNGMPINLRAFYKRIFRAPTFNDLYYTNFGNTNIKPEYANQYNVGITFQKFNIHFIKESTITLDAYYNTVTNKIVVAPRQNLFQFTVLNIGLAKTKGLDAAMHLRFKEIKAIQINADITYSYQQALDYSNATSALYKTQLPYTPPHSGSASIGLAKGNTSFNYNLLYSSYRYRIGEPNSDNFLQGWATSDINVSHVFNALQNNNYKIIVELNNIFNARYDIIKFYPTPTSNYRITLIANFKK